MTDVVVKILTGALLLSAVALTTTQAAAAATDNNNVVQSSASSTSTFTSTETPADLLKSCNPLAMDRIIRWLFFFNEPNRVLPRNAKEFEEFCDEKSRKEVYVNAYARRCLGQFPRQVTSLLMFGVARQNRYYCSYTKGRNEIIQGAKCLNAIKEKGAKCMSTAINDMKAIKFAPTEGKIAKTCCTYYRLEECLVAKVQEEGNKACTPKDPKRMEELLEGYTGQMISHVCARFPKDVDHCAKVLPKRELNRLRKLAASAKAAAEGVGDERSKAAVATVVEYKSILQPMIDILDSIPP